MADVFISYAQDDRPIAKKVARVLQKNGLAVWWDREIQPGRPFADVIKEELEGAKCVVVLWSKHSTRSHWVKDEASEGLERNILVPALINDVEIPLGFRQAHAADLIAWNGASDDEGFRSFLDSVRSLTQPPDAESALKPSAHRVSPWRRGLNLAAIALLGLFSMATLAATCANPDAVMLSIIAGLPAAAFLLIRVRGPLRFLWVLAPIAIFAVATPIGSAYGTMTRSALFGIPRGSYCQPMGGEYYLLGGLSLAAVVFDLIFYFWGRRHRRWIPVTALGILMGGSALVLSAELSRHSDQYDLAASLARKYGLFSTGNDRWSRPSVRGFPNDFTAAGSVVSDAATGLMWQRTGSPESLSFAELPGYISELNSSRFEGFDDWRIPSLAEAWTLLEDRQQNGLHIDSLFGSAQTWIWTSTIAEDGYGWFVFFASGRPIFQNAWQSHAYVRAVRGKPFE